MLGSSRLVPLLLIAAHVILPVAAFTQSWPNDWTARNVSRVFIYSEAGMLCVWAGLSSQPWSRRLVGALAGLAACWTLLWFQESKQTPLMLVECLLFPGAATVILVLAIQASPALLDDGQAGRSARWQFSVGQLLIFTTMTGVLIVLVQQFLRYNIVVKPRFVLAEGSQISIVIMTWAAIGRRWRKLRIAIGALMACGVGLIVQSFMSESWFWLVLENIDTAPPAQVWEDLASIPTATLVESLLAAATIVAMPRFQVSVMLPAHAGRSQRRQLDR